MSARRILFHAAAREKVLHGAQQLADAVRITLGPKSKSVLIQKKFAEPLVCNDGVTIAREVELPDAEEELGARMMREAAQRTGDAVGDGTTTSVLLAFALFSEGVKNVTAGASAIDLKRGMDRGAAAAVKAIRALSRPVASRKEKAQIATVSAHNDRAAGDLVAEAVERVGSEGVVTVEESKGTETTLEVVEGMQLDRGYLSSYFVTDPERMECVLEDPSILLIDKRVGSMEGLVPALEETARAGRALLLVAEDVESEALATLVVNKLRGVLRCAAVKAPGFGDRRKAILQDLAVLTGAQLVSEELGMKADKIPPEVLGRARRVVVDKEKTTVIGGLGDKAALAGRAEQLRAELARTTSDYDKEKLQERLAHLTGGVAVIKVGAASEAELKSRKDAFDDAISATRAAAQEGVVPGAGLALLRAIAAVEREEAAAEGDERTGIAILKRALEVPTRQLAENSGVDGGVVVEKMREGQGSFGFDAAVCRYVDLVEAGIIDPTRVVRTALENAVSVAGILLLTEATLTEIPTEPPHVAEAPLME